MTKAIFYLSLLLMLTYLGFDVVIRGEEKIDRPIVQTIAGTSLLCMLIYNSIYHGKSNSIFKEWSFTKTWFHFTLLAIIYYGFSFIGFPSEFAISNLRDITIPIYLITILIFIYKSTINGHLKGKPLNFLILFLILNGLYEIYWAVINSQVKLGMETINTSAGYIFVMMLPLLMYEFKKEGFWIFVITLILTLMTGKRGAVIIYAGLIFYSIFKFKSIFRNFRFNWKAWLFIGAIIFASIYFIEIAYDSLQHRMLNIENQERGTVASGRDIIWGTLLTIWADGSLINQFFGFGSSGTKGVYGNIAHNDFIEFLINYGVIGLTLWIVILFKYNKNIKKLKNIDSSIYYPLLFGLLILIGRGMAAGTWRTDQMNWSISIGYLLAIATMNLKNKKNIKN